MILTKKHGFGIYRRFQQDLWGVCFTDLFSSKLINLFKKIKLQLVRLKDFKFPWQYFFSSWLKRKKRWEESKKRYIYRLDVISKFVKRKYFSIRFLSIRITRLYFWIFQDHQFRKLFRKAVKSDGNFDYNYCYLLEGRIPPLVHRMNFATTLLIAYNKLKNSTYTVDFKKINSSSFLLPMGKLLSLNKKLIHKTRTNLLYRLINRTVMFPSPTYFFISFDFMFGYLTKFPGTDDLTFPTYIDLQRVTGYY